MATDPLRKAGARRPLGDSNDVQLAAVIARVEAIEQWRAEVQGSRGARDADDRALLVAIAESIGDRRFTSGELIHHATIAPALHEALRAADVQEPHELGVLFRRLQGITIDGMRVERTDDSRAGAVWRVLCEDDRRIGAPGEDITHDDD